VGAGDDEDVLAGVVVPALAEDVVEAVGDVLLGSQLALRRNAAVAQPAMLPVRAGAVEHNVGFLQTLALLLVADEQAERLFGTAGVGDVIILQTTAAAPHQPKRLRLDAPP